MALLVALTGMDHETRRLALRVLARAEQIARHSVADDEKLVQEVRDEARTALHHPRLHERIRALLRPPD